MFEKIYVISLQRRSDRREALIKKIEEVSLTSCLGGEIEIQIFDGIDGHNLNHHDLKELHVTPNRQFRDPSSGRGLTWGEVGCATSHYGIWATMVEQEISSALVLEDDVIFCDDFSDKIKNISSAVSDIDFDVLFLGRKPLDADTEDELVPGIVGSKSCWWTSSYVITNSCAQKFINTNFLLLKEHNQTASTC